MCPEALITKLCTKLKVNDPEVLAGQLQNFKDSLLRANARINLVSRRNGSVVVDQLLADSLALLELIDYPVAAKLLDIGSGAGFPWIPHKLVHQSLQVVSVDANRRKIEFQRSAVRVLALSDCELLAERIEALPPQNADVVIAKAVGNMEDLLEWSARHLRPGGRIFLPRSATESWPGPAPVEDLKFVSESRYGQSWTSAESKLFVFNKV